jgi:hypothetical protein
MPLEVIIIALPLETFTNKPDSFVESQSAFVEVKTAQTPIFSDGLV